MELLKERQDLLVEAAQKDLGRVYLVFSSVAAFFTLFTIFIAYRQVSNENRRQRIEDQHLSEMQSVMNSFRDNITILRVQSFLIN